MADIIELLERLDKAGLLLLKGKYADYCYRIIYRFLRDHGQTVESLSDVWLAVKCTPRSRHSIVAPGGSIQEILPFLSQVREMLTLAFNTSSLVSFPDRVTVPPAEVKEDCLKLQPL